MGEGLLFYCSNFSKNIHPKIENPGAIGAGILLGIISDPEAYKAVCAAPPCMRDESDVRHR